MLDKARDLDNGKGEEGRYVRREALIFKKFTVQRFLDFRFFYKDPAQPLSPFQLNNCSSAHVSLLNKEFYYYYYYYYDTLRLLI